MLRSLIFVALCSVIHFAATQPRELVGTWSKTMTEYSGTGLHTQLELRADGTYEFLVVVVSQVTCPGARHEPGLGRAGEAVWYRGRYRVSGRTLALTPTAGRRGCTGRMTTLPPGSLRATPGIGNSTSTYRLAGRQLCLHRVGSDSESESCLER